MARATVRTRLGGAEPGPLRFLIAGAIALIAILVIAVTLRSDGSYEVDAVFEDVRGLIPGGAVKAGSDEVGTVEDITLGDDGLPVVTMKIDNDFRLRQGAFADIRLASNVGGVNRFVDLEEGHGPELPDGATLGPSRTDQPVDLDLAVSDLDPKTRAQASAVLAAVDASIRGRGDDLDRALRHSADALGETANVLAQATYDRAALKTLVGEGRTLVGALATSPADLGEAAQRLADLLDTSAARQQELARATDALGPGLTQARTTFERLDEALPNLTALTEALRPAAAEIVPTVREIRPAIAALKPLLADAGGLIDEAPAELRKIKPVLRAAVPVLEYLPKLLDAFGPMLDYTRAFGPETVNFFTLLADATSSYDAAGNMIRSTVPLIQFDRHPGIVDAADSSPGLVERPFLRLPGSLEGEPWRDYYKSFIGGGKRIEAYLDDDEDKAAAGGVP
jgi:phospholipid/cholesterol/gamma-HCH transport system substrate-binding protein